MHAIVIILLSGCLAWFISWFYIKLLFFPTTTLTLGKHQWESVFYKMVKKLPIDSLLEQNKTNSFATLLPFIDQNLDSFFKERLVQKMPVISMFIGEKTITQLKEVFLEELQTLFPELIGQLSQQLKQDFLASLSSKWAPIFESIALKATQPLRLFSFLVGCLWGGLIYLILIHL
jgi:hypothetical protein